MPRAGINTCTPSSRSISIRSRITAWRRSGYLRHIGIQVPVHQLALAFYETYGLTEDFNVSGGRNST